MSTTPQIAPSTLPLKRYRTLLTAYLLPYWQLAVVLFVLLFGSITLELLIPQILRNFIDTAHNGGSISLLTSIAVLFLVVAVGAQLVSVGETYAAENLGWKATNRLRADLALHCLRLDPSFHNAHTPGELIERIDGDVQTLSTFFSQFVIYVLSNVVLLAGVIVMLYRVDWRVGLAGTAITAVSLVIVGKLREFASPLWREARQASADLMGFIEERISGTEDIRSSGATDYTMLRLHQRSRTLLQRTRWASLMGSVMAWGTILMFTVGTAVSLGLGAYLFQGGAITIGTVYLIFSYTQMLNNPIEEITRQLSAFQQAAASVTRIQGLLATQSAIVDGRGTRIPTGALSIELDGVSFRYGDDSPVLRDVSLRIEPGSVLGVLGRTGSGKTTLSRLIFRLYDPQQGSIRLGGTDVRDARVRDVRTSVGMVTQDIQLFHATVRDNLTFFDDSIPDRRVREVLEDLGLWEWCASLPQGLDTRLAANAVGLSAGEAQLLAFARVFLKDPGVVILDEASSRLDPATERRIEHAVDRLLEGRTGIVIAHRLHTVRRADDILVLEEGTVREYGPRAALQSDPASRFSELLRAGLEVVA